MSTKDLFVAFVDKKVEDRFTSLHDSPEHKLHRFIERAIKDLKRDASSGTKIPKKLWPRAYVKQYGITNLWKYDLPNAWRLIYTIQSDEVMIISIILEWFSHKEYERKFKY